MNLNFSMSELTHSDTAVKYNINNMPDINSMDCMLDLIYFVLQPLRDKLKKPIKISSGFRNSEVNKLVGGVGTSQHCKGQAADIIVSGMTVNNLINFIKSSGIEYDQLINEYDRWVHISFVRNKNRKQCFKIS
jgi:uncharacterized protein YcbK (DUF882 family)